MLSQDNKVFSNTTDQEKIIFILYDEIHKFCKIKKYLIHKEIILDILYDLSLKILSDYKNFNWQNIKQIKSYIIKSLNNRINNHLKKNKIKRSRLHQVCQNIYFQEASNEDEFIDRYASIISILDKLTIDEHKFLDMHYSDGMTLKEIAAYLQKTEDSIKQKHRRLKAKIRLLLDVGPRGGGGGGGGGGRGGGWVGGGEKKIF